MKPKAQKYRLAQQSGGAAAAKAPAQAAAQAPANAAAQAPANAAANSNEEKLTPRQLRIARRVANKHGLSPESDIDAVRMLREKGINPFQSNSIVDLAVGSKPTAAAGPKGGDIKLPQKRNANANLPSEDVYTAEKRAAEIRRIQRDIARRRRIKMALLVTRLTVFVFIPTLITSFYFYVIATPMYESHSEFLILNAEGGSSGAGGMLGGMLPSQFATGQDSVATQSYLESKDALMRLDEELGFRKAFSSENVDIIQRLDSDASLETMYKVYKRFVKIGYDQTEGVIRMDVSSAAPELSKKFSEALINYAEEMVDDLSREKREDSMKVAMKNLEDAKNERRKAQERLVNLQENSILDPEGAIGNIRALIGSIEAQLQEKQVALKVQLNNARPNRARVDALKAEIGVLEGELDKQNARLNEAQAGDKSLAAQTAEIRMAEADAVTADMILQASLESKRQAEIEAGRQVRYLTVSVKPSISDEPSYPKAFENTILALLVFSGIYLFISLTASILRDQISS